MKNTIRVLGFIAMIACATLSFGEVVKADALKEYLESRPANSPDAPIKISLKMNASMFEGVADILRSTDKYVSIDIDSTNMFTSISIPDSAFRDCKSLINMDLKAGVTKIGKDAFRGCSNLVSLKLPSSLSEFSQTAYTALADCPNLTTIDASSCKLYSSAQGVLYDKEKRLLIFCPQAKTGALTVPGSVWNIAPYAFYGSKLTSISMSGGYGLNLQRGVMDYFTIGDNAFINCSNLTGVTIKSAAVFNANAFDGNLREVYEATAAATSNDGRRMLDIEKLGGTFTRQIGSNTWTMLSFPSGFMGTWKRDNFGNRLSFSANSFTDSAQRGSICNLARISGDSYTCYFKGENEEYTLTFRLVSGNIVIEGDSGTGQLNWNGTWKKQ